MNQSARFWPTQTRSGKEQSLSSLEPTYFPAVCSAVHRPFLAPLVGPNGEALSLRCPVCGAAARVITGLFYSDQNDQHFQTMVDIVQGHQVPAARARATLVTLDSLRRKSDADVRAGLVEVLNEDSFKALESSRREELEDFISLLSGLLSVQFASVFPPESTRRRSDRAPTQDELIPEPSVKTKA